MTINTLFSDSLPQTAASIPYLSEDDSDIYLFHIGIPSVETFPKKLLKETLNRGDFPWDIGMQYSQVAGSNTLREGICRLYAHRGERAKPEEIMITAGIAEAFDLLPELFINPGDVIYTEDPSYPWAIRSFKIHRSIVKAIKTDRNGMDTELLEKEIKKDGNKAKIIYTMPVFHNPLGMVTPWENRLKLLDLAEKYNLIIVEDDPYRELSFSSEKAPVSLRELAPERVINLGTFSKTIGGGVRLGWIWASGEIINRLSGIKHTGTVTLLAEATGRMLKQNDFYSHLENCRNYYRRKKEICRSSLLKNNLEEMIGYESEGGFYYWLKLPDFVPEEEFYQKAFEEGVYILSGKFFSDSPHQNRFFRLSFSYETEKKLSEGIGKLAELINRFK